MSKYVISAYIFESVSEKAFISFLESVGEQEEYKKLTEQNYRIKASTYISQLLNEKKITAKTFNDFLFEYLKFGLHRGCFIASYSGPIERNEETMNKRIRDFFHFTNGDIVTNDLSDPSQDLLEYSFDYNSNEEIIKIWLLFGKKISTIVKENRKTKYIYIPVSLDLDREVIVIKTNPHIEGAKSQENTYQKITEEYLQRIRVLFPQIRVLEKRSDNVERLNELAKDLVNDYFSKVLAKEHTGCKDYPERIKLLSKQIISYLGISDYDEKKELSQFYDIEKNIQLLVENVLFADYISENESHNDILIQLQGFLSYIKYDGRNGFSLTLRERNYARNLALSESFLRVRGDLEQYKEIEKITVRWYMVPGNLRPMKKVNYEVQGLYLLQVFFHENKDITEDDFNDAVKKFGYK